MSAKDKTTGKNQSTGALRAVGQSFVGRGGTILILFVILSMVVSGRLFALTVLDAEALAGEGTDVRTTEIVLTASRGTMYDRNGNVIAISVEAVTIYANPTKITDPKKTAEILGDILGGNAQDYLDAITKDPDSTFVYIAKKVDTDNQQKLQDANQEYLDAAIKAIREEGDDVPVEILTPLTGIEFLPDTRREYPAGNIGAQIIGAVNDEGIGVSGLEQTYDSILRGVDGVRVVEQAKRVSQNKNPLPMIDSIVHEVQPIAGNDLIITIDIEMQQFLELNLQAVANQRKCESASTILLDGSTGEIIAAASIPLYDRDNITAEQVANGATNVKAITQPYEPGSTFKSVIAGIALEQGVMGADDVIYCPPSLQIYDYTIRDSVDRAGMEMSLRQIIAKSSNIGVSLIEQQVGSALFYEYLLRMGLGTYTHVDYPGETPGTLASVEDWSAVQAANIAFGQGLEVSLLQVASIYGAIANDGIMMQPHFLLARPQHDIELQYKSTKIFEPETCRTLNSILRSCVTDGYGENADVPGYEAAGKTGTAEIGTHVGGYGTTWGTYVCSFVGYLDNSTSNYVFMSAFEDPINYADSPATPFFSVVMSFAAHTYMILPQERGPIVKIVPEDLSTLEAVREDKLAPLVTPESDSKVTLPTPQAGSEWVLDTTG
ncbi:MAG: penicillin-binding protein 2 [Coriobacteriia bacterium]|nr:penicillin-binding protein 2 [Coriobacteriia bacterium]MCL2750259.1 penicillin-binding protein 2 [Coriobacteriia bacterium]